MEQSGYIISISKEQLADLPVTNYPGKIVVVDRPEQVLPALKELSKHKTVGFDTETKPCFRKGMKHKVALMQISTPDTCYLFRLNRLGLCAALKDFLENPAITKIGLSLHDDFNVLGRSEPLNPAGFIDLQKMVKDFEIADISLQKIYAIIYGERISKGQRLTNWEADSLTQAQQAYAALDAWACLRIYSTLSQGQFEPRECRYRHLPPTPDPEK